MHLSKLTSLGIRLRGGILTDALCGLLICLAILSPLVCSAASDSLPSESYSWSSNTGWINWSADPESRPQVTPFVCSGSAYSANLGWINLGGGTPSNGTNYLNTSESDFGLNVDVSGNLRGMAYGANIGWIDFPEVGEPKIDWQTGKLSGFAYAANVGWISLDGAQWNIKSRPSTEGPDTDLDGIPDGWELLHAADLDTLSAEGDHDGDGQTDLAEYLADTDPDDATQLLKIAAISMNPIGTLILEWRTRPTLQYSVQIRSDLNPDTPWTDTGMGWQSTDQPSMALTLTNAPGQTLSTFRVQAVRKKAP